MSKVLKDPSKPAYEIIEVLEDGDAIRNDGVRLGAANKNPWYVLATICGEQEEGATLWDYNEELAAKNRRAWNGWLCGGLSEGAQKEWAEKTGLEPEDFAPLTGKEVALMTGKLRARLGDKAAELPQPAETIDFSQAYFPRFLLFRNYYFEDGVSFRGGAFSSDALFDHAEFEGNADFEFATFSGRSSFYSVTFGGNVHFADARFVGDASFRYATFDKRAHFEHTTFDGTAKFSSVSFKGDTKFDQAKFKTYVPEFHMAGLYDEMTFTFHELVLSHRLPAGPL